MSPPGSGDSADEKWRILRWVMVAIARPDKGRREAGGSESERPRGVGLQAGKEPGRMHLGHLYLR